MMVKAGRTTRHGYTLRPFRRGDQAAARAVILAGLAERWGRLDPSLNPDVDDIWTHYVAPGGAFLVATWEGTLVGTGGLSLAGGGLRGGQGRIERVSVHAAHRRRGLGRALCRQLIQEAERREVRTLLVETTASWLDAVHLYRRCRFYVTGRRDGNVHLRLDLAAAS